MPTVTVPGASNGSLPITFTFNAGAGFTVAQQIAAALAAAVTGSQLSVTTSTGATIPPPGVSGIQELVLTGSPSPTVPAGYGYVVNNAQAPSTITAAPATVILAGAFGGTFSESAGPATIVASASATGLPTPGNNVITQSGAGPILLIGGGANDTITGAGAGSIVSGAGADLITASGSGEYVQLLGADTVLVTAASGTDTVDFSTDTVQGSVLSITGAANVIVYGAPLGTGSAPATIQASVGADTAFASTVGGAVYNTANATKFEFITPNGVSNTIMGGTNTQATLFGGSGSNVQYNTPASSGGALFVAAGGNETLNAAGASAPILAWAGTGSNSLTGGSGSDTLVSGSGSVTMTGNGGANYFDIIASRGPGTVTIADMNSSDFVQIFGYGATQGTILSNIAAATGSTFSLTDGTTITFLNTTVSAVKNNILTSSV